MNGIQCLCECIFGVFRIVIKIIGCVMASVNDGVEGLILISI